MSTHGHCNIEASLSDKLIIRDSEQCVINQISYLIVEINLTYYKTQWQWMTMKRVY